MTIVQPIGPVVNRSSISPSAPNASPIAMAVQPIFAAPTILPQPAPQPPLAPQVSVAPQPVSPSFASFVILGTGMPLSGRFGRCC